MRRFFLSLFCLLPVLVQATLSSWGSVGYRLDNQSITFSGEEMDPYSELCWKELQTVELEFAPTWQCGCWYLGGLAAVGSTFEGTFEDSDWLFTDRQMRFSHTFSDVRGYTYDVEIHTGIQFGSPCVRVRPQIGGAYHQQYCTLLDLYQTATVIEEEIDADTVWLGALEFDPVLIHEGIVGTTRSEWGTGFLGGELLLKGAYWSLELLGRFHVGGYRATGDWQLRPDRLPGKSWRNLATVLGGEGSVALYGRVSPCGYVRIALLYRYFATLEGNHYSYFVDEESATSRLNPSHWTTLAPSVGFFFCY